MIVKKINTIPVSDNCGMGKHALMVHVDCQLDRIWNSPGNKPQGTPVLDYLD